MFILLTDANVTLTGAQRTDKLLSCYDVVQPKEAVATWLRGGSFFSPWLTSGLVFKTCTSTINASMVLSCARSRRIRARRPLSQIMLSNRSFNAYRFRGAYS